MRFRVIRESLGEFSELRPQEFCFSQDLVYETVRMNIEPGSEYFDREYKIWLQNGCNHRTKIDKLGNHWLLKDFKRKMWFINITDLEGLLAFSDDNECGIEINTVDTMFGKPVIIILDGNGQGENK